MTIAVLIIASLALAVALGCLSLVARRPALAPTLPAGMLPAPPLRGRTVVVVTDTGSVRGVLIAEHADRLTLAHAERIGKGGDVAVDGYVHVPLAQVRLIQDPAPYQVPRP